jgi:SAM-dependent methyltransferase
MAQPVVICPPKPSPSQDATELRVDLKVFLESPSVHRGHLTIEGGTLWLANGVFRFDGALLGVEVHGIDSSEAMVARLREKPGGDRITVSMGDFGDFDLGKRFSLVFVAFNTLFALPDQEAQLSCFVAVSRHLLPGGRFVVEAFVPDLGRFDRGQRMSVMEVGLDQVVLECSRHDAAAQTVTSQQVALGSSGTCLYPVHIRYAWPSELDLMARIAGLQLEGRWDGWDRRPFTAGPVTTISVWRAPLGGEPAAN